MGENKKSKSSLLDCFKELYMLLEEEWRFYGKDWTQPGFRAMAVYRFGVWRTELRWRSIKAVSWLVYKSLYRYVRNHYGIEIPYQSRVGRRLRVRHQHGITVHDKAAIGDDCELKQMVTIGGVAPDHGYPKLGNRVTVGVGAVVVGGVEVGDDVKIGPNAVVMTDVPSGARVFGNPARVITAPSERAEESNSSEEEPNQTVEEAVHENE